MNNSVDKQINLTSESLHILINSVISVFTTKYLKYVLGSIIINIILFVVLVTTFFAISNSFLGDIANPNDNILINIANFFLDALLTLLGIFLGVFIFPTLSSIVCSPIYDTMTENLMDESNIENKLEGRKYDFFYSFVDSTTFELKKTFLSLFILFVSFVVNVIPILGQVLFLLLNYANLILINGVSVFRPPLYRDKKNRLRDALTLSTLNPSLWLYLWITATLNAIPIVNIFTIPITIYSSILLYKEIETPSLQN